MKIAQGPAEFDVPDEIGEELFALRRMRGELVKLHVDAKRWIKEEHSPNLRAAECRIGKVLALAKAVVE